MSQHIRIAVLTLGLSLGPHPLLVSATFLLVSALPRLEDLLLIALGNTLDLPPPKTSLL
jgi:hypothetical protein